MQERTVHKAVLHPQDVTQAHTVLRTCYQLSRDYVMPATTVLIIPRQRPQLEQEEIDAHQDITVFKAAPAQHPVYPVTTIQVIWLKTPAIVSSAPQDLTVTLLVCLQLTVFVMQVITAQLVSPVETQVGLNVQLGTDVLRAQALRRFVPQAIIKMRQGKTYVKSAPQDSTVTILSAILLPTQFFHARLDITAWPEHSMRMNTHARLELTMTS